MISSIIYFKISSRGIHRTTSNRLRGTTSCLKASMATAQPEPSATVSTQAIQGNSSLADSAMEFRIKNQLTIKGCDASLFPPMTEFKDTPFSRGLRNVFKEEKYDAPTPIQAQTWPIILGEKDVISIARTGSGKTCGFVLPGIQRILEKKEGDYRTRNLIYMIHLHYNKTTLTLHITPIDSINAFCRCKDAKSVTINACGCSNS